MRSSAPADHRPSRTAVKQAARAVTELAHAIATLPEATYRRLPLDTELRADFDVARKLKSSGARDRQLRHLGAVLREDEELLATLRSILDGVSQAHYDEARLFHELEGWRERLLDPQHQATALVEAVQAFPALDRPALERALQLYQKTGDKGAFRTMFRLLREAAAQQTP